MSELLFSDQDYFWMSRALELARNAAQRQEVPVGAVVVGANGLLGEGFNCTISECDPTGHAEIQALRQACLHERNYRLPGATVYVTIEPCAMCAAAMVHARIARLVYGAPEPKAGVANSTIQFFNQNFLNHKVLFSGGCLEEESRALIQVFFAERRALKKQLKQSGPAPR